jgi:curved DNA-binding protein CbpA
MTNSPFVDHYETLQVSQTADCETVERVYRLLAKRYHPDNSVSGNTERFTQVQTAHEVLSNPELRAEYDVRYDQEKAVHWQIFDQTNAADGHEYDQRLFHGILSVLYVARRRSPNTGGLGEIHLERMLATPREHLDFPLWYLKQHNWIERLDNGMVAITIDGIDKIGSKGLALPNDRLLTESSSGSSDQRAGAEKPATRSLPGLPGAPSRQHVIAGDTVTTPVTDAPHVLVVDDDGATRLLLRRALEEEGYSVDEAASDEEGKASVERRQPDAVLLNTDSTHRDGFAFSVMMSPSRGRPRPE